MAANFKVDFDELYKSVFQNSDEVQLLTEVETRFIKNYMKTQAQKNDRKENDPDKKET